MKPYKMFDYFFYRFWGILVFQIKAQILALQTRSLYKLQGTPCVLILPCKDPVKITGYHSNPSKSVVRTFKNCNQYREIPVH